MRTLLAAVLLLGSGCSLITESDAGTLDKKLNSVIKASQKAGAEVDGVISTTGKGTIGGVGSLDLGARGEIKVRLRPGELAERG